MTQAAMDNDTMVAVTQAEEWLRAISDWLIANDHDMMLPSGVLDADPLDIADALARHQSGRTGAGEALRAIREIEPEELWGIPDRCTGDRPSFQTLDANEVFAIIDAALSQSTVGEDGT